MPKKEPRAALEKPLSAAAIKEKRKVATAKHIGEAVKRMPQAINEVEKILADHYKVDLKNTPEKKLPWGPASVEYWAAVQMLKPGQLICYGTVAEVVYAARKSRPGTQAAQQAGTMIMKNPVPKKIPTGRVVGSDGLLIGSGGIKTEEASRERAARLVAEGFACKRLTKKKNGVEETMYYVSDLESIL